MSCNRCKALRKEVAGLREEINQLKDTTDARSNNVTANDDSGSTSNHIRLCCSFHGTFPYRCNCRCHAGLHTNAIAGQDQRGTRF